MAHLTSHIKINTNKYGMKYSWNVNGGENCTQVVLDHSTGELENHRQAIIIKGQFSMLNQWWVFVENVDLDGLPHFLFWINESRFSLFKT